MSVKSTRRLTRDAALDLYIKLLTEGDDFRDFFRDVLSRKPDSELEDELMEMNDKAHGGEGFENYWIVPDDMADE